MQDVRIRLRDHGPLVIEGACTVVDAEGNPFPLPTNKPFVALCRCGASQNKPFCDGSHKHNGFQAADRCPPIASNPTTCPQTESIPNPPDALPGNG